jgi:dienelactone hydrolase
VKRDRTAAAILFLVVLLAGGCGGENDPVSWFPETGVPLQSFEVTPPNGAGGVPVTEVVRIRFHRRLALQEAPVLELRVARGSQRNAGAAVPWKPSWLRDGRTLILYPLEDLAPGTAYEVWLTEDRASLPESSWGLPALLVRFRTSGSARSGTRVDFDPLDPGRVTPYPCDIYNEPDMNTPTGMRRVLPEEIRPFNIRAGELEKGDGFSTFPRIVLPLTGPVHERFVSAEPAETQDPAGPLFLVNADPDSAGYGERVALLVEEDPFGMALAEPEHALTVFPARPLEPGTTYALVVTRRLTDPGGGPVEPSETFRRILGQEADPRLDSAREVIGPVADALQSPDFELPLPAKDLALVLPFTTRSSENLTGDLVAIRDFLALTSPQVPPRIVVTSSSEDPPEGSIPHEHIGRFVKGTVECRDFRGEDGLFNLDRIHRRPWEAPAVPLEFILTIPRGVSESHPAGLVIFLHGIDDVKEQLYPFADSLAREGIAAIAIDTVEHGTRQTDPALPAWLPFLSIQDIARGRDNMRQTEADLLSLTRAVQWSLNGALGEPILKTERLVFTGFSLGGILGSGYLALEPSIQGAALFVMGGPFTEIAVRNEILEPGGPVFLLLANLLGILPGSTAELLGAGAGLNQEILDPGDPISFAPYVNGTALTSSDTMKDLLLIEALDDTTMANRTTENMARAFGMEIVRPVISKVPGLVRAEAPLAGNGPNGRTAGLVQFDQVTVGGKRVPAEHGDMIRAEEAHRVAAHFLATCLDRGQGEILSAYPGEPDRD